MKIGRNDLCPCGSGKKFKKCHLGTAANIPLRRPAPPMRPQIPPDLIARASQALEKQKTNEEEQIKKYGKVMPVMHAEAFGGQMVIVKNRIYKAPEKSTFTNFLFDHGRHILGDAWFEQQDNLLADDRHPLYDLLCRADEFISHQPVRPEGYISVVPNGPLKFCDRFYYNLYTVDHNNELRLDLLHRLRNKEQFQGAAHELFVEAICLRAGFNIIRQHFSGPMPRNAEFTAVHKETGQHLSIEAKSRHRPGVMAVAGVRELDPTTRFGNLINEAVAKDPNNPMVIFIDTNLPPHKVASFYTPVSREPPVMSIKMQRHVRNIRDRQLFDPYNLLVFTNQPQHYVDDDQKAPLSEWAAFTPENPRVKVLHPNALKDLIDALDLSENIPTDFPKLIPGTNVPE